MLRIPLDRPGNIGRGFSLVGRWREPLPNLEKGVVQAGAGGAWAEQVPRRGAGLGVGGVEGGDKQEQGLENLVCG